MESLHFSPNKKEGSVEDRVLRYFVEHDFETAQFEFDTKEEAEQKVAEINGEYGDIAFVAEDRGRFAVKFRASHLGEGLPENPDMQGDVKNAA